MLVEVYEYQPDDGMPPLEGPARGLNAEHVRADIQSYEDRLREALGAFLRRLDPAWNDRDLRLRVWAFLRRLLGDWVAPPVGALAELDPDVRKFLLPRGKAGTSRLRVMRDLGFYQRLGDDGRFWAEQRRSAPGDDRIILCWEEQGATRYGSTRSPVPRPCRPRNRPAPWRRRPAPAGRRPGMPWWGSCRSRRLNRPRRACRTRPLARIGLLDNYEVLKSWRATVDRLDAGGDRGSEPPPLPKLAIVTVSGGGIRASVWTATVLQQLEEALGAEFPYHVRLITGASGGMVCATYYAATLRPPDPGLKVPKRRGSSDHRRQHGPESALRGRRPAGLRRHPGPAQPLPTDEGPGAQLEDVWTDLFKDPDPAAGEQEPFETRLRSLADDERAGRLPSLVFTPMLVEDGRRLLISNLDLKFVCRNVGG